MVGLERLAFYQNAMQSFLSTHTALKSEEMCNLIQVSTYLTFLRSKVKKNCLSHDNIKLLYLPTQFQIIKILCCTNFSTFRLLLTVIKEITSDMFLRVDVF